MTELTSPPAHRIVIVGGGAGGLPLATALGDKLGDKKQGRADITLVDRFETHLWKPLLHEVAAGRMDAAAHDVDYLALGYWHHFRFRQGAVVALDRAHRKLTLGAVDDDEGKLMLPERVLPYDTLILCIGSTTNDFGVPGVAANAISLDTAITRGKCRSSHREARPGYVLGWVRRLFSRSGWARVGGCLESAMERAGLIGVRSRTA